MKNIAFPYPTLFPFIAKESKWQSLINLESPRDFKYGSGNWDYDSSLEITCQLSWDINNVYSEANLLSIIDHSKIAFVLSSGQSEQTGKRAKLAEYKLSKNGFKVELSVTGYESIVGKPYFWRTHRINESIGGKPRVKTLTFELDKSKASFDGVYKYKQVKIDTSDVKRLSSYEPKHSTFFGIYYTITSLHALHVFGGILVMIYNLLPIGLATWYKDREQFANRIESYGLFWHFVDLVWIFLFPILYIL